MTADIWVIFMLSLPQMLCMVPMHVNTTFNCCFRKCVLTKFLILCESANKPALLIVVTPLSH